MSRLAVLDFGSQYTQLIVRRFRELGVYAEIFPANVSAAEIAAFAADALVLSGGPASIYQDDAPKLDPLLWGSDRAILAICYGMQLLAEHFGGEVTGSSTSEYGKATLKVHQGQLFTGLESSTVWMSHGDSVGQLPEGFLCSASTPDCPIAAIEHAERAIYGIQFHPEVHHSADGQSILANFLDGAGLARDWQAGDIVDELVGKVQAIVGEAKVLLGISGGVDSTTLGLLLHRALGKQLFAVFVDHGLLRQGEADEVRRALEGLGVNLYVVDAKERFFTALEGVSDPEAKRKIIGRAFIEVFNEQARALEEEHGAIRYLAQGTLYPDVVESAGGHGAANIKSHHNVGGLPEEMDFVLLEPFRKLFKDEVRDIAKALGLSDKLRLRHPFPGPGLAIRCLGEVSPERIAILQRVDRIFIDALHEFELYKETWQALAVLTPLQTVGVMGDGRTYSNVVALRAVSSVDGMTADWTRLPHEFLAEVSSRIVNQVKEVNRVVFDITSKPPGTIEWE